MSRNKQKDKITDKNDLRSSEDFRVILLQEILNGASSNTDPIKSYGIGFHTTNFNNGIGFQSMQESTNPISRVINFSFSDWAIPAQSQS